MQRTRLTFVLFITLTTVFAQDHHYWYQQVGAHSSLMGGAVIAGVKDHSALFYNPARFFYVDSNILSIGADLYKMEKADILNGGGAGYDLRSLNFDTYPQLLSGEVPLKKHPNLKLGFIVLMRNNSYTSFNATNDAVQKGIYTSMPDSFADYIGSYKHVNKILEEWAGGGFSYKLSDVVTVGVTEFICYRFQKFSNVITAKATPDTPFDTLMYVQTSVDQSYVRNETIRSVTKLGLALDFKRIKIGLCLTTSSLHLYGNGDVEREYSINNLNYTVNGPDYTSFIATDAQYGVKGIYKSPWSVSGGFQFNWKGGLVELAGEYFAPMQEYQIVQNVPKPFLRPANYYYYDSEDVKYFMFAGIPSKQVFNVAIAVEQALSQKLTLHASFRTDFNLFDSTRYKYVGIPLVSGNWDLYHFAGGVTYKKPKNDYNFGLDYSFARTGKIYQYVNLNQPKDYNYLLGDYGLKEANAVVNNFILIVGYTHYFK